VPLLDTSAQEGVRRVALRCLDEAAAAATRLHDPDDAEALHDFRVGMRRLRSCLRSYDALIGESVGDKGQRRLSRIASATNPGRDAEVQLSWVERLGAQLPVRHRPGVRWLATDLGERRAQAYQNVREDLHARFVKLEGRLRERLSTYTVTMHVGRPSEEPSFASVTARALEAEMEALSKDLVRVHTAEDERLAHRSRIHGKRLRYLLEPLRPELDGAKSAVKSLRTLQDLLGDLHDLHNLSTTLGQALEAAAVDRARQLHEAAVEGDGSTDVVRALRADERPGLLGLLRRVQNDRARLFEKLHLEWLADDGLLGALQRDVAKMVGKLDATNARSLEIERKYLLRGLPPMCEGRPSMKLDQGYLPGERLIERIRRKRSGDDETYVRTVKLGEGIARTEVEEACTKAVFEQLWALTKGKRVRKRRFTIPDGALVWEIDAFDDRALFLAEVELPTIDTEAPLPEWLAPYVEREVTDDPAYVNANLAS
jgi:CHAD domain-containing protein/CYTH domain-containing protein